MKIICLSALVCLQFTLAAQSHHFKTRHVFIITTDGFRWQEVFTGADPGLINDTDYVRDTALAKALYWDNDVTVRRKKLMPFFWNVIATKGQLYGNRLAGNKVNVKNVYKISYPGYNEILTGYADPRFIPNTPVNNRNINILEYLNAKPQYQGKVVAFTSWEVFPFILNRERNRLPVNSGYEALTDTDDSACQMVNRVQESIVQKTNTRYDMLTFMSAFEYIRQHKPEIAYIGLGETDEFAHHGHYDSYLQQGALVDKMIADLWYYVQTDPYYKDSTTFIITTDHGRGTGEAWRHHGTFTKDSGEIWLAVLGPDISAMGELKLDQQVYQNQIAATVAWLLGEQFDISRKTGKPIVLPLNEDSRERHIVSK